jgi:hypothetical protein
MRLGEVIAATADRLDLSDEEARTLSEEAVDVTRELLELGALHFRGD